MRYIMIMTCTPSGGATGMGPGRSRLLLRRVGATAVPSGGSPSLPPRLPCVVVSRCCVCLPPCVRVLCVCACVSACFSFWRGLSNCKVEAAAYPSLYRSSFPSRVAPLVCAHACMYACSPPGPPSPFRVPARFCARMFFFCARTSV